MQNPYGTWSAPKGHVRINNGAFETPKETAWREFNEEVKVASKKGHRQLYKHYHCGNHLYLECRLQDNADGEPENRLIGLIVIKMLPNDEEVLSFEVQDRKENQVSHSALLFFENSEAIRINV